MRKIHTLGPNTTDSVAAAAHIPGNVEYQLVLHDSLMKLSLIYRSCKVTIFWCLQLIKVSKAILVGVN